MTKKFGVRSKFHEKQKRWRFNHTVSNRKEKESLRGEKVLQKLWVSYIKDEIDVTNLFLTKAREVGGVHVIPSRLVILTRMKKLVLQRMGGSSMVNLTFCLRPKTTTLNLFHTTSEISVENGSS